MRIPSLRLVAGGENQAWPLGRRSLVCMAPQSLGDWPCNLDPPCPAPALPPILLALQQPGSHLVKSSASAGQEDPPPFK